MNFLRRLGSLVAGGSSDGQDVASAPVTERTYISGTGRAGTSFLIQLFTHLGLDTGYDDASRSISYYDTARAGFEWDLFDPHGPQFQKSPFLCDHLDALLARGAKVRRIIIPVRDITDAARSRVQVQVATTGLSDGSGVTGGLWSTTDAAQQEAVLRHKLTRLIEVAVRHDIPMIFLHFPRLATDCAYLYRALSPVFPDLAFADFQSSFDAVSKPALISKF